MCDVTRLWHIRHTLFHLDFLAKTKIPHTSPRVFFRQSMHFVVRWQKYITGCSVQIWVSLTWYPCWFCGSCLGLKTQILWQAWGASCWHIGTYECGRKWWSCKSKWRWPISGCFGGQTLLDLHLLILPWTYYELYLNNDRNTLSIFTTKLLVYGWCKKTKLEIRYI